MKNKESFLKELQSRLTVLEEAEQQDILAEYAQHIDLRVQNGLSEEAAIQDFGDIDQLAAEILGAYHVKPTYQTPEERPHWSVPDPRPALQQGAASAGTFFRRTGGGIAHGIRRMGSGIRSLFRRCGQGIRQLFRWRPRALKEKMFKEAKKPMESKEKKKPVWAAIGHGARDLARGVWYLIRTAAWLAWNLFLLLCALPFVGVGLLALVCLGVLAVLLVQGYPLAGVTLCCLGGVACCVGILGLGNGLVWHRVTPTGETAGALVTKEPTAPAGATSTEREEVAEDAEK